MVKIAVYDKPASRTFPGLEAVEFLGNYDRSNSFHGTETNWIVQETIKKYGQGLGIKHYAYSSTGIAFHEFLDWAVDNRIDVLSISISMFTTEDRLAALQRANNAGIIVVAAAGNEGPDDKQVSWPARDPDVIAVAAWADKKNTVADYSSRGADVFITAQGTLNIPTPSGNIVTGHGTSFATPEIAAYAAIWKALKGGTRGEFKAFLKAYAKDVMQPGHDNATGWGLFSWPVNWKPTTKKEGETVVKQKVVVISDGHGINTAGKQTPPMPDGTRIKENRFNAPAAKFCEAALIRSGIKVIQAAPEDTDTPLDTRVQRAIAVKADAFAEFHFNAFRGNWDETKGGVSTHYQPGDAEGKRLAACVQKYIVLGTPQENRGIVAQNLFVTRETGKVGIPAIVVENGFMDVHKEAALMLQESFQKEQGEQVAQGVCEYLSVTYIPDAPKRDELAEAVGVWVRRNLLQSPEYWIKNAIPGGVVKGEYAAVLIKNGAKEFEGGTK